MAWRNDGSRYGAAAMAFHWLVGALVLLQFPLAIVMDSVEPFSREQFLLYSLHKSVGVTVLLLVVARLAWRLVSPPPPLPAAMPGWERRAAHASHAALYLLLLAQPIVGLIHGFASGFPTVLYFAFTLPSPIAADQGLTRTMETIHFFLGWGLLVLVVLHVAAALRHHFVVKDDVLTRMLPRPR